MEGDHPPSKMFSHVTVIILHLLAVLAVELLFLLVVVRLFLLQITFLHVQFHYVGFWLLSIELPLLLLRSIELSLLIGAPAGLPFALVKPPEALWALLPGRVLFDGQLPGVLEAVGGGVGVGWALFEACLEVYCGCHYLLQGVVHRVTGELCG